MSRPGPWWRPLIPCEEICGCGFSIGYTMIGYEPIGWMRAWVQTQMFAPLLPLFDPLFDLWVEGIETAVAQEQFSKGELMDNMHLTHDQLAHRFQFHPADAENTQAAHQDVRDVLLDAADKIVEITGAASREQSLAITKLEEAMFWANAAIARGDGPSM